MIQILGHRKRSDIKVIFDDSCNQLNSNQKQDIIEYFNYYNNGSLSCEDMGNALSNCHHKKINVYQQNIEEFKIHCG